MKDNFFWRAVAVVIATALVLNLFRGESARILPRAEAGGLIESQGDIFTTNEEGSTLYRWSLNGQFLSKETAR